MDIFSRQSDQPEPGEQDDDTPEADEVELAEEPEKVEDNSAKRLFDTALGAGSTVEGVLSSDGNVRIDGVFKGKLEIGENILIGVTAEVEADIIAKNVSIGGRIRGNVTGNKIHLLSTAQVWGDIEADSIITEEGAFIEGRIGMTKGREGELALPFPATDNNRRDTEKLENDTK